MSLAIPFFGYKNHISTDKRYGFIRKYEVTDASCYDGKILPSLLDKGNTARVVWGDTAYRSIENEGMLANHRFTSCLHRKKPKGKPMSAPVCQGNRKKSTIKAKVEHVFAVQKEQMGLFIRTRDTAGNRKNFTGQYSVQYETTHFLGKTERFGRLTAPNFWKTV